MTECTHCRKRYENEVRFCPVDGFAVVPVTEHREPWVGRLLMGQFAIQAVCGHGATGTVYRASQVGMERQVAVKVLRADLLKDPDIVKRFVREARAGAKVSHPNIATVHMVGQTEEGAPFIVMEYIDGRPLSALLDQGRSLPLTKIVQLSSQIAAALTEAHAQGIVHRDLKPENILISERRGQADVVKLVDFGIAKILVAYAPGEDAISRMGTVFGTPHYIAPEQASGQAVDGRADLYSLGCIVFQMATGRVPFDGKAGLQVLLSQVRDPVIDPREINPNISDALAELILSLLEKDPAARPQTAKEVRAALLALVPPSSGSAADKSARGTRTAVEDDDAADDDDQAESDADGDGPSLDAWASGPHDDAVPAERPRTPPVSARRPVSGTASAPKSGRRADPTPRNPPRSGRPSSAQRPRPIEPSEPVAPRRHYELIDDDAASFGEPFYKRHAKPLLGVLGAITIGLLFGVFYAQLRSPAAPQPAVTPPGAPATTPAPTVPPVVRPGTPARPSTTALRPIGPVKPGTSAPAAVPVSATAPAIPATTLPATGSQPAAAISPPPVAAPVIPSTPAPAPVTTPATKPADKPAATEKPPEAAPEKPADKASDKATEKATEKPAEKPVEKPAEVAEKAEKSAEKTAEKAAEKPADKPKDKPKESPPEDSTGESGTDPYGGLK